MWRWLSVAAVLAGVWAARGMDPLQDADMKAGVVPGADFLVCTDAAAWRLTPIQKRLKAMREEVPKENMPPEALRLQARMEEFGAKIGIQEDDLDSLLIAAQVQRAVQNNQAGRSRGNPMEQLGIMFTFKLGKPLSLGAVRAALSNAATEDGYELLFEKGTYNNAETLTVVPAAPEGVPKWLPAELFLALTREGKVGFVGQAPDVKAAVDRLAGASPAPLSPPLGKARAATLPGAMTYLLFVPAEKMRQELRAQGTRMQQNPMMGGAMQALAGMEHLAFGAKGAETIQAALSADFAGAQEAVQVKTLVDMMVLGMAKMMLMQAIGRPIPLVESMVSNQAERRVEVRAELTEEDCKALMEIKPRQRGQGGPGFPPPPGGPPGGVPAGPRQ
ncbi:MAG: hypothetical protein JXR77_18870 [Lentisphaeria bacterium]|nr:hypothetical protein [Lentisphaeria bacterium]